MKYIVLVGDGMADYPLDELFGKTPLEAAKTPNMDLAAKGGCVGIVKTIPDGFSPGSDVANLSILGYDPKTYYRGRGPLEAANLGVEIGDDEVAFRCNLITSFDDIMVDYSAGHITTKEAAVLIENLDKKLGGERVRFYPGTSYRHLLVVKDKNLQDGLINTACTPPHDITGKPIKQNLPKGKAAQFLIDLTERSKELLEGQEINKVRVDLKENPANMIWLWGQGTNPSMPTFGEKYKIKGSLISAVDLLKGIARLIGLNVIDVPGATGYYDTNYLGKAQYGIRSLKERDFIFIHIEAPDEAGHNGDVRAKMAAIENFDKYVVGTVLEEMRRHKDWRLLLLPDHTTPVSLKTHTAEPVLFALYGKGIEQDNIDEFNELAAQKTGFKFEDASLLMGHFINA